MTAPAHEGMIPDAIRAALEPFRGTQRANWRLEVQPEDTPGEWREITGAGCTLTGTLDPARPMASTFTVALLDGRTTIKIPAPDYPCIAARQAVYDHPGRLLIATVLTGPDDDRIVPGDTLTWRAS